MTQKFKYGDHVQVAKDLGPSMSHFTNDCEAIVESSYNDEYGGGNIKSYTIFIKDKGGTAWYKEHQLTLIKSNRIDLLEQWKKEMQDEIDIKSNIDWIFDNSDEVLKTPHGSSISKLAECLGCNNLWGSNGEGIAWYRNAMQTLFIAEPFLKLKDKDGWLKFCESRKE